MGKLKLESQIFEITLVKNDVRTSSSWLHLSVTDPSANRFCIS